MVTSSATTPTMPNDVEVEMIVVDPFTLVANDDVIAFPLSWIYVRHHRQNPNSTAIREVLSTIRATQQAGPSSPSKKYNDSSSNSGKASWPT